MKQALILGGNGTVAQLTTPKLQLGGFEVTSVIHDKGHVDTIIELGAAPVIQDITRADLKTWQALLDGMDLVIWAVDGMGKMPAEAEQQAAIQLIDAVANSPYAPRLLLLSTRAHTAAEARSDPSLEPWLKARLAVEDYFCRRALEDALLLGPGGLVDGNGSGIRLIDSSATPHPWVRPGDTSRGLVSRVLVEMAFREDLPVWGRLDFINGHGEVSVL
ncbi:hypothetical protein COCCU_07575 [Corynebacterium occultum]|uniref:NAD(P)-binding domain-containing protein n=1 Tax=Corynebacterium occultum TaxID=2675219 RepID=A0A6B8WM45_9CORY|nr:NAD(P)H-binding protein [Corynebacterium occultum]QGU07448.1 hypothetical protein COCCU_07575 [Corynebacterium occultum]